LAAPHLLRSLSHQKKVVNLPAPFSRIFALLERTTVSDNHARALALHAIRAPEPMAPSDLSQAFPAVSAAGELSGKQPVNEIEIGV
jgi:hypothetical protein